MAAVLAPAAASGAVRTAKAFSTDPLGWTIRACRWTGLGFLIGGFAMGSSGWYLQASATTAENNEMNTVGNLGSIFSNIKPLTFQPAATGTAPVLGPNPLQDVQDFFGDAQRDVQAIGSDVAQIGGVLGTLGEDVAIAVIDIAKSVLAFVMHFPDILWNGLVWGVGGAISNVLLWLFPYFIVVGIVLVALSLVLEGIRWSWDVFVTPGVEIAGAKLESRVRARWSRILRFPEAQPEAPVPVVAQEIAVSPTPPEPILPLPEPVSNAEVVTQEAPKQEEAAEPKEEPKEAPPEVPTTETKPPEAPAPEVPPPEPAGTTEETEAILGGVPPPGWTQEQFDAYLKAAPKPEKPRGRDIAVIASQLLSSAPAEA